MPVRAEHAEHPETEEDNQHKRKAAGWVVAPSSAMRPYRCGADAQNDHDPKKHPEKHDRSPKVRKLITRPPKSTVY